jgi:hypothetical protein
MQASSGRPAGHRKLGDSVYSKRGIADALMYSTDPCLSFSHGLQSFQPSHDQSILQRPLAGVSTASIEVAISPSADYGNVRQAAGDMRRAA